MTRCSSSVVVRSENLSIKFKSKPGKGGIPLKIIQFESLGNSLLDAQSEAIQ